MSCISSLLFTCIPCLCDIKFYKQTKKIIIIEFILLCTSSS